MILYFPVGSFGGCFRPDPLSGCVHARGVGHEDQPDRGTSAGERGSRGARERKPPTPRGQAHKVFRARLTREGKLSHSIILAMHFNNINIMVNIRLA